MNRVSFNEWGGTKGLPALGIWQLFVLEDRLRYSIYRRAET